MNLENRTILITGANRGIGRALVEEALKRGVKRVYAGTRSSLQHSDKRVTTLTLDVTNAEQIQRAVGEIDTLDILINNAGIAMYDDLTKPEVIEQHLAVNLFGPLNVTRAFLPLLKRSKGAIVNNISTSALAALPIITRLFHFQGRRAEHDSVSEGAPSWPRRDGSRRLDRICRYRYDPRRRLAEGLARVRRSGHLRWRGKGRRGDFP